MLKQYYQKFSTNKYIVKFGKLVSAKNLWHFNRKSVTRAMGIGVACAWIPLPFHTVIALFFAILADCNLPIAAAAIWVANPLTMPFMYYLAYRIGASILNTPTLNIHFHITMHSVLDILHQIWQPFLLGCLVAGLASGLLVYLIIHLFWPSIDSNFT